MKVTPPPPPHFLSLCLSGPFLTCPIAGITYEEMHGAFKGESIYLAEFDVHFAELTLGQTLGFAASTRESGSVRKSISQKLARDMAVLLGLEGAFGTWIGDAMIRGVSGGEKRRTSLAEALICGAHFQCWDNSIRGLDSSTSLRSVKLLRDSSNQLQTTVAMSIYQASDLIYEVVGVHPTTPNGPVAY